MNKNTEIISIVAIVTCFNRCSKTITCLKSLIEAYKKYNEQYSKQISLEIYLTDDGCTDNTVAEVESQIMPYLPVTLIKGTGNLFWAGGMRAAWTEALKRKEEWDYFLLLNDDSVLFDDAIIELFKTDEYCVKKYKRKGLYSGITTAPGDKTVVTYGGNIWDNRFMGKAHRLQMSENPQRCDTTNANILMVPSCVVEDIGIFYERYIHGAADYDYAVMANRKNIPVLITAKSCGECEFDHTDDADKPRKIAKMSLDERRKYFAHPLHSVKDHLTYTRRVHPFRYPFVLMGRLINLYLPQFYVFLYDIRIKK